MQQDFYHKNKLVSYRDHYFSYLEIPPHTHIHQGLMLQGMFNNIREGTQPWTLRWQEENQWEVFILIKHESMYTGFKQLELKPDIPEAPGKI